MTSVSARHARSRRFRILIVASMAALAGCAAPGRPPPPAPPAEPVVVSEDTWWEVDRDMSAASLEARKSAADYASAKMERWRKLVQTRTESDFIPWFADYWTQKWLSLKVAWYRLSAEKGKSNPSAERLAAYLQEQYHDRVLAPAAREVDPDAVREQATALYVRTLSRDLREIRQRHAVPDDQFERRIKDIPAIALAPQRSASLYQLVHADPVARLPAYAALVARIRKDAGATGIGPPDAGISAVAKAAAGKLESDAATSGGASAAAALVGGVPGAMISLGAAGLDAIAYGNERPKMEKDLRERLGAALDEMWRKLMEDPDAGVMAGVHHISAQIEGSLSRTETRPLTSEALPQGVSLPAGQPASADTGGHEPPPGGGGGRKPADRPR